MPTEQSTEPRILANLWRRLGAFFLDCLLLAAIGIAIGHFFAQRLVDLGPWGRLLGFAVALIYFGALNSRLGKGQTLGKRLLKIKVIRRDGTLLSVPRALLRFVPLGAPWFLNNAQFPESVFFSPWIYVLSVAIFGIGLSVIYLYFFNRQSRQSLHDLLVGSYVVVSEAPDAVTVAGPWRPHLVLCALLIVVSAVVPYFAKGLAASEPFVSIMVVLHAVQAEPWVALARVSKGTSLTTSTKTSFLNITAYAKDPDIENAERAKRLAKLALAVDASATSLNVVEVRLVYGYDIGIASSWKSHYYGHSPAEWLAQ